MHMPYKKWNPIFAAVAALVLAALACSGGQATQAPTSAPPADTAVPKPTATAKAEPTQPTGIAAGELQVVSTSKYTDSYDYVHIVGEIMNQTERPLQNIELTLVAQDASGATVLQDSDDNPLDSDTLSPFLYSLAPGESSPFDYYFSLDNGEPDTYEVTVTGFETGDVNRADLDAENMQMVADDSGNLFISGEVVNKSDAPAEINSIAGAALDDANAVVAANGYGPYAHLLAPAGDENGNDRTPFRIRLDSPGDVATQWAVYFDADLFEDDLPALSVQIDTLNFYTDTFGGFHLVGTVTNNGEEALTIGLVAGLYDADGVALDADTWTSPVYVGPGATIPYDFPYFSNVNSNSDQSGAIDKYTVQTDLHPFWTYTSSSEYVELETSNDDLQDQGDGYLAFKADVTNTSGQALSGASVVIGILDADGNLIATTSTYIYPDGDEFSPDATLSVETTLYVDPDLDASGLTPSTWVQGSVK
jgi:hypothetical protein